MAQREHKVTIVVAQRDPIAHHELSGFTEYQLDESLIDASNSFSVTRPLDLEAWRLCKRDSVVRVLIDGKTRMLGLIDDRQSGAADGTMTISGRDSVGRLVDESAPRSAYGAKSLQAVIEALADPWYRTVTLSNATNRRVQLGKGAKVAGRNDAIALIKGNRSTKNIDPIKAMFAKPSKSANRINPGQTRWDVIRDLTSKAGITGWATADGKQLFVGTPDHTQPATFMFKHARGGGQSNVIDIDYKESNAERYSMITAVGSGISSAADYGEAASSRAGVVLDNPDNKVDGTGRDFQFPKRLILPEQGVADRAEASRVAAREQARRDFHRTQCTVTTWYHGQLLSPADSTRTLFAPDTIARCIREDIELDEDFMIYAVSFRASREQGETTELKLVPRGTEVVQ
jgi:prophage tail gpP-like protein